MQNPPTGTVTFLFTDLEGSTKRWEQYPQQMQHALRRHDTILRSAIEEHTGYVFKTVGDAFCAAFSSPHAAVGAALGLQRALLSAQWPAEIGELRVRAALHTGAVEEQDGDYFGQPVNRVARLLSAGHGGQVLLSQPTYDLVRDALPPGVKVEDMGEHRLKDLQRPEHVYQLVTSDLPSEFPTLKTLDNRPNNLPVQSTAFIGREKEVAAVVALLRNPDVRLVTLTGPGGTGKTRLGLQVAAEVLDDFEGGVYSVELAALTDPSLVASTIAQTLGVTESAGKPLLDSLREYLKDRHLLLLLDNFEQVAVASSVVDALMKGAARLKVLATSRVCLNLYGEHEYAVPPLSLPDPKHLLSLEHVSQYEAVRLFIERAQAVKSDFTITNENAPAVAEICVRLDGLPLAIELAAARVKLFSPQALLSRLGNRLKMLTGGASNLPRRQQTLRAAIEWSYDLLSEGEKQFFRRMAVFQGGRTLEGLEAVCNYDGSLEVDVLDGVESLVNNSLLGQREGRDGEPRFWMLETIHEYAREKLQENGEAEALHREHALYFMTLAEEAQPHLVGKEQQEWLERLEEEYDNIRAALRWGRETNQAEDIETGLRLAGAIWRFWLVRGYFSEGLEQLSGLLVLQQAEKKSEGLTTDISRIRAEALYTDESKGYRAKALNGAGLLAHNQGDYATARSLHNESLALKQELGDKQGIAASLGNLGLVAQEQGDHITARSLHEESLVLRREIGHKSGIAYALTNVGIMAQEQGDHITARSLHEESLAMQRELGDKRGIAMSLVNLGIVAHLQEDYTTARSLAEESLVLLRELGDKWGIAAALNNIGNVAQEEGDYASARALYEESLLLFRELGNKLRIAMSLAGLGRVAVNMGRPELGARVLGAVEARLGDIDAVLDSEDRLPYERAVESARSLLEEEPFERAWQQGRAMSMEQAIKYALEEPTHV
jgi:predicted ATPase/class 3 adenylate cyclase